MSKVIITGGAGFIGSHIAQELIKRGHRVTIVDNLATGRMSNIKPVLANKNTEFIRGSIINLPLLRKLFSGADYIFHQAAMPGVPLNIKRPRVSHVANIIGTLNVLLAARDNNVKKVVFASSSAVYGDTSTLPNTEDITPNPQSPYAVTKLIGEHYCIVFQKIHGLNTICLRYFNVFGPRQNPGSEYAAVIPVFVNNVLAGKSPVIFGNGEQTRDFIFISDVVEANILAAESPATGVYNIGSGTGVTINYLAQLVIKMIGNNKIKVVYQDLRSGDILHSYADITRAESFGYHPKCNLEKGLREVIKYMRSRKLDI